MTIETDELPRPAIALPRFKLSDGRAKTRIRQTNTRVLSSSNSNCLRRILCIVVFCNSFRNANELKSTFFGRLKLKRCMMNGIAAATSPSKTNGLRNVIIKLQREKIGPFDQETPAGLLLEHPLRCSIALFSSIFSIFISAAEYKPNRSPRPN